MCFHCDVAEMKRLQPGYYIHSFSLKQLKNLCNFNQKQVNFHTMSQFICCTTTELLLRKFCIHPDINIIITLIMHYLNDIDPDNQFNRISGGEFEMFHRTGLGVHPK